MQGIWPASQKHALVKPRLKKPNSDQDDLNLHVPISNLSFISKTIKHVVTIRFHRHGEAYSLLSICQSAYIAYHSTETVAVIVHINIEKTIE